MINLVNFETKERFNNFPYTVSVCDIGVVGDFYPDYECNYFMSFSRYQIPFNDDYVLGKSKDVEVSNYAYKRLIQHYKDNYDK